MRTIRTPRKRQAVLDAIAAGETVSEAAQRAGISRRSVFDWRNADPEFARDFEAAYAAGTDTLEAEARRRGFAGSDVLLIFLLKQRDPKRFNQKMLTVVSDPSNPIAVDHAHHDAPSVVRIYKIPHNGRDEDVEIDGETEDDA
jgi:superfamily I DNA/RNA helicase